MLNEQLIDKGKNERLVTALHIRVNLSEMSIQAVSAGHPPFVILHRDSSDPQFITLNGTVLGMFETVEFDTYEGRLFPKDFIFLFTDGVLNTTRYIKKNRSGKKIGLKGLSELLKKTQCSSLSETIDNFWDEIMKLQKFRQDDDLLLLGLEI